jgi:hypothetical protein
MKEFRHKARVQLYIIDDINLRKSWLRDRENGRREYGNERLT